MIPTVLVWVAVAVWAFAGCWVAVTDLRRGTIPRRVVWAAGFGVLALLGSAALLDGHLGRLGWALVGAASILATFEVVYRIFPNRVGYGDVRLMVLNGFVAGWWGPQWSWWALVAGALAEWPIALRSLIRDGLRSKVRWAPGLVVGTGGVVAWLLWSAGPTP